MGKKKDQIIEFLEDKHEQATEKHGAVSDITVNTFIDDAERRVADQQITFEDGTTDQLLIYKQGDRVTVHHRDGSIETSITSFQQALNNRAQATGPDEARATRPGFGSLPTPPVGDSPETVNPEETKKWSSANGSKTYTSNTPSNAQNHHARVDKSAFKVMSVCDGYMATFIDAYAQGFVEFKVGTESDRGTRTTMNLEVPYEVSGYLTTANGTAKLFVTLFLYDATTGEFVGERGVKHFDVSYFGSKTVQDSGTVTFQHAARPSH